MSSEPLIPKHGGYRNLKSFQVAQLVYDVTARFCDRFIDRKSRTHDQMVQAARSGVQNIAEGSSASGTSKKTELKLTSVARASLEELRLDYEDFLRQRSDPRKQRLVDRRCSTADEIALWVKEEFDSGRGGQESSTQSTKSTTSTLPEIAANAALTLIAVASLHCLIARFLRLRKCLKAKGDSPRDCTVCVLRVFATSSPFLEMLCYFPV